MVEQIDLSDGTPFFHQINGQEFVMMSAEAYLVMHTRFEQIKLEIAEAAEARMIARIREPDAKMLAGTFDRIRTHFSTDAFCRIVATAALAAAADAMEVGDEG